MRKVQLWLASAGQGPDAPIPSLCAPGTWPAATFSHSPGKGEMLAWEKTLATDLAFNVFSVREDFLQPGQSYSELKIRPRKHRLIYLQIVYNRILWISVALPSLYQKALCKALN